MLPKVIFLVCALSILLNEIECSKILVVYPCPSKSHLVNGKVLFKALAARGHNLTVISNFPLENSMENYRDIYIPVSKEISDLMTSFTDPEKGKFQVFLKSHHLSNALTSSVLENTEVQQIMKEESFDLVIFGYIMNDALLGMGAHFNCPQIILWANSYMPTLNSLVGNPEGTSYVPNMYLGYKGKMNFRQRLINSGLYILGEIMTTFVNYNNKRLYEVSFPSEKYPTFDEIQKNVSLVFVTTHFSVGGPRPNQPNIIEIGGIQAKETPSPLPEDIKEWLDSAKDGAIYMSLGTNLKSSDLSQEKINAIITVFGKLKQKVLWKFEAEILEGKPDNVKIGKWLPQDDILAHPNVKLFITHGGLGGLTESKFHGVPVLGIPFFGDQPINLKNAANDGWAVVLDIQNITEDYFSQGINEVLNNKTYANTVKEISNRFRDRPVQALDTAVYWTEYVLRHRGANHLQSNAIHLNFFQLHSIDIWALVIALIYIGFKVNVFLMKLAWRKLFSSKRNTSDVKMKIK